MVWAHGLWHARSGVQASGASRSFFTAAQTWRQPASRITRAPRGTSRGRSTPLSILEARAPPVWAAIGMVSTVSAVAYLGCAHWSVRHAEELKKQDGAFLSLSALLGVQKDMEMAVQDEKALTLGQGLHWLRDATSFLPSTVARPFLSLYVSCAETYLNLPSYKQAAIPIIAVNTGVFLAWLAAPRFGRLVWMRRYFTHRPTSGRLVTLLTSVFSHRSIPHFVLNNVALYSVGSWAIQVLQARQLDAYPDAGSFPQFLSFYLSAGLFASLASHLVTAWQWRMAAGLRVRPRLTELAVRSSLGASGAIYAAFALCACAMPHVQVRYVACLLTRQLDISSDAHGPDPMGRRRVCCLSIHTQAGPDGHHRCTARLAHV